MVFFKKYLPIASLIIGTTALTFQILVLYPWHKELDNEFRELKRQKLERDKEIVMLDEQKISKIKSLENKVDDLISGKKH